MTGKKECVNTDSLLSCAEVPCESMSPKWTPAEESRLVRKLDFTILPLLILPFVALQLARGNAANALSDTLLNDIPITLSQYNFGQQILFLGIVLLEIPSNLVLYRFGPSVFISAQILAWGLVATFQTFIKGRGVSLFLFTRSLLGLCESGYIPAALWTITCWYRRAEWARRFAYFFTGNVIGQASSGLVAYGVLQLRGRCGLSGWQWLFLIEGCFTLLVAIIFAAFFPASPKDPMSLFGMTFFSNEQLKILRERKATEGDPEECKDTTIKLETLWHIMSNWKTYPHLLINLAALAPTFALWQYAPTMMKSFGYGTLNANAFVSIGGWGLLLISVFLGWIADKSTRRSIVVVCALTVWFCLCLVNYVSTRMETFNQSTKLTLIIFAIAFSNPWLAVNAAWLASHARSSFEISVRMAMFIMAANLSGIIGSQLFQAIDRVAYAKGWLIMTGMVGFAVCIAGAQILVLYLYKA